MGAEDDYKALTGNYEYPVTEDVAKSVGTRGGLAGEPFEWCVPGESDSHRIARQIAHENASEKK